MAFKFTPLSKVRLHRIKIFLSQNVEYWCRDKKVHRLQPVRKLLLYEKQAQKSGENSPISPLGNPESNFFPGTSGVGVAGPRNSPVPARGLPRLSRPQPFRRSSLRDDTSNHNLLGNLEGGDASGVSTEFEFNVSLPGCRAVRTPLDSKNQSSPLIPVRFHHGTIWPNIQVHHWIKIVLRISKVDETSRDKPKRRHFEISIDSPIHLLSVCRDMYKTNSSVDLKRIHPFPRIVIPPQYLLQVQI